MFGDNHKKNNFAFDQKEKEQKQNKQDKQNKWDTLEQVDDVYCSDTFNLFNDLY